MEVATLQNFILANKGIVVNQNSFFAETPAKTASFEKPKSNCFGQRHN